MTNYHNSKIYKIISPSNPSLTYYGSTTQSLSKRMVDHKRCHKSGKTNITSKNIVCFDDAIIVLVELYPCDTKKELLLRESEYILNNICVNKLKNYNINTTTTVDEETIIDFVKNEVPKYKNKTNTVSQFKIKNIFKKTYKIEESPFTSCIFDLLNSTMTETYGDVIIINGLDYYRIPVKKHKHKLLL